MNSQPSKIKPGNKFGRLTVVKFSHSVKGHRYWNCNCICGEGKVTAARDLRSGHAKSCGCLRREASRQFNLRRRRNKHEIRPGDQFARLTVVELSRKDQKGYEYWKCICVCGESTVVERYSLVSGHAKSCGCYKRELCALRPVTHGLSSAKEYSSWEGMIQRCTNPRNKKYKDYGGRGIKVCDEWRKSFEAFYRDMGPKPSPKHSIDRFPDNDGHYEPSNCRWATSKQQRANQHRKERPNG